MSKIIVIGPWNTGTNLIHNILSKSCCINTKTKTNTPIGVLPTNYPIWKHQPKKNIIENMIQNESDRIIVIMYRNIYNWINSMLKASYEVTINKIHLPVSITINKKNNEKIYFNNLVNLYNHYYQFYRNMLKKYKNVIFFNYDKIINKYIAFDYINSKLSKFNISLTSSENLINQLNKPAKNHGKCVKNADEALNKINCIKKNIQAMIDKKYYILRMFINNELIEYYENDYFDIVNI